MFYCSIFCYFCIMNALAIIQNIPAGTALIGSLFPHIKGKGQKVQELEKSGQIIRLKRGLYVVDPEISGKTISTELIANHLYGPSYVSMLYALRYYGLIPESVYMVQSLTVKHSRMFENRFGQFKYVCCPSDYFSIGLTQVNSDNCSFVMASPEKALCDHLVYTSGLNFRYKKELIDYLEYDLRFDMDAFLQMNPTVFEQCAMLGKKSRMLNLAAKILEK